MHVVADQTELERLQSGAALVMFGGADCTVCSAVKPKLEALLADQFPRMEGVYLDCQGEAAAICAQEGFFSIPVVQIWFESRKYAEFVRVFSIGEVAAAITQPYGLAFE